MLTTNTSIPNTDTETDTDNDKYTDTDTDTDECYGTDTDNDNENDNDRDSKPIPDNENITHLFWCSVTSAISLSVSTHLTTTKNRKKTDEKRAHTKQLNN